MKSSSSSNSGSSRGFGDISTNSPLGLLSPASPKTATRVVNMRITPEMDDILTRIVEQRQFGYETRSDIVRDALNRHMIFLSSLEPDLKLPITIIQTAEDVGKCAERNLRFLKVLQSMSETVGNLISNGMQGEAARLVHTVKTNVDEMPDSDWKAKYISEINKDFSKYLEALPDVSLWGEPEDGVVDPNKPEVIVVNPDNLPVLEETLAGPIGEDGVSSWFPNNTEADVPDGGEELEDY